MTDNYQQLIDDYLRNKLSDEKRNFVENLAKTDVHFRTELDFHRQMKAAFAQEKHQQLKNRLKNISTDQIESTVVKPIKKTIIKTNWLVAASILLVLSFGIYIWKSATSDINRTDLYAAYFEPYPNITFPITRNELSVSNLQEAYAYYEKGDYSKAYELFGKIEPDLQLNFPEISFYKAISAMKLNLMNDAIELFQKYKRNDNVKLLRQANWYEALCHVQIGNQKESKELLQNLIANPGFKNKEAIQLLKQL